MPELITSHPFVCPHCWEANDTLVERQTLPAEFVEDCRVCCHPVQLRVSMTATGEVFVEAEAAT